MGPTSLIIPVLDAPDAVLASLQAVVEATDEAATPYEIVLTAAVPATEAHDSLFASLQGDVQIVRAQAPIPLGDALNLGGRAASGTALVFLEPGVSPRAGWLPALLEAMAEADLAGTVLAGPTGKLLRGGFGLRADWVGDVEAVPLYPGLPIDDPLVGGLRRCKAFAGGAIAVRRDVFESLDGFESDLDGVYMWLDLGLRATAAGVSAAVAGSAVMQCLTPLELSPRGEFVFGERFKERWSGVAECDLFEHYAADGFALAGVRGPSRGTPERLLLVHRGTGRQVEARGLEAPWPRTLLTVDRDRLVLPAIDGEPWSVPEGGIERSEEVASHYELVASEDIGSTHQLEVKLLGASRRILELGCASGYLTRHLVRMGCSVVGVEIDPIAAEQAARFAERVFVGDLDHLALEGELEAGSFDAIVAGDVLEHLRDPESLLRRLRPFLAPGGCLVGSVPNVTHGAARLALLAGQWRYRRAGLLDRTHMRFFTRWSLKEMLRRAGYRIDHLAATTGPVDGVEIRTPAEILPPGVAEWVAGDDDALIYQFVFRAVPVGSPPGR